jgi:hypothetical protein
MRKGVLTRYLLIFFLFIGSFGAVIYLSRSFPRKLYATPTLFQLAAHWSPYIYQGTKNNYDLITNFDFDGNWNGKDNWENAGLTQYYENFHAYVYYAVIESANHYFFTYMLFHPRDTGNPCYLIGQHENDSESCRVVVLKDGSDWGTIQRIETVAHDSYSTMSNPTIINGSHPAIFVCERKHAIYGTIIAAGPDCCYLGPGCIIFPGSEGTGVCYSYAGRGAEVPSSKNDRDVSYELISIESTLWAKRSESLTYRNCWYFVTGTYNWDEELQLCGHACSQFGSSFRGDNRSLFVSKCAATPPWAYAFEMGGYGKWFIDPLMFYGYQHCDGSGEQWVYNPYFSWVLNCPAACD